MPFFFCCKWGGGRNDDLCKLYNERRKSDDCLSYQAPGVASVIGDPHFITFDGMTYTFNGKGEFVLVRSSGSVKGLDIQARFEQPITNKEETEINATKLTAIVARVNNSSLVEFRVRPEGASWQYRTFLIVDGEYRYFWNDNNYLMFRDVTIYQKIGSYNMSHIIALFHSGVGVEIVNNDGNLAANIYLPKSYLNNVSGLLGKWSGSMLDDFNLPDNETEFINDTSTDEKIHYNFAMKWRVTEKENNNVGRSLFNHEVIPFEIFDDVNFKPKFADEMDEELQQSKVLEVCGDSFTCVYDFLLTGDKKYALMSGLHERRTEIIRNGLQVEVIRCPSLPAPSNGKKSSLILTPGTIIEIQCDKGYRLIGESKKICQGNGTWTEGSSRCVR